MEHKCGIIGISSSHKNNNIFNDIIYGLLNLQHRGKESCGLSYQYLNGYVNEFKTYKKSGLVKDVFDKFKTKDLSKYVIGHVRYSTSGGKKYGDKLIQPFTFKNKKHGLFSIVHNGNIPHYKKETNIVNVLNDTLMLAKKLETWEGEIIDLLKIFIDKIRFAFCLLIMFENCIYVIRDKYGYRPLCLGQTDCGVCVSSESCALGKYKYIRDIIPGEIGILINGNYNNLYNSKIGRIQHCSFEHIYFMNKNTISNGFLTVDLRKQLGKQLGKEEKLKFNYNNTIVCAIPRTAIPIAQGYAIETGLQYSQVLKKSSYYGRTFILPDNTERKRICNKIFKVYAKFIKDKNIILVDDSIVRGNTILGIAKLFFENGCSSLHIRVGSPPVIGRCFYGIDIPTEEELIANDGLEDLDKKLGVTSVQYLSKDGLKECFGPGFCTGCFTKKYIDW